MSSYAIMTTAGRNKEAAALANGTALAITQIAWGDGDRSPGGGETTLLHEVGRKSVQGTGTVDGQLNAAFFEILLDVNEGPFIVREAGLFDATGTMIAVARYDPPINKPAATVTALIRINVVFYDLQNLNLSVQSTDAYVPVERTIGTGSGLTGGGNLSQNRSLSVAFANSSEAIAGTVSDKSISPLTLKATIAAQMVDSLRKASPIGELKLWSSHVAPLGYLEGDRASYSRAAYPELWAHIQASAMYDPTGVNRYAFGPGNKSSTFEMPETRGEFLRFWDHGRNSDAGRGMGVWQDGTWFRSHAIDASASDEATGEATIGTAYAQEDGLIANIGGPNGAIPALAKAPNGVYMNPATTDNFMRGSRNLSSGSVNLWVRTRPRNVAYMAIFRAY